MPAAETNCRETPPLVESLLPGNGARGRHVPSQRGRWHWRRLLIGRSGAVVDGRPWDDGCDGRCV